MNDWEATCRVKKVMQRDRFGCGIACAAMVAGKSYSEAKRVFTTCGLGKKKVHRAFPGKAALIFRKKYSESRNP
uniref:Peptidase C39 domain-containing protein n=1 Tax=Pseudomonas aeruginosa TaxID=287 RepID=A0A385FWF2_PSEAI|nr:hypothetical protein pMKPA34_0057 [Pseudomonas aeruginosa]